MCSLLSIDYKQIPRKFHSNLSEKADVMQNNSLRRREFLRLVGTGAAALTMTHFLPGCRSPDRTAPGEWLGRSGAGFSGNH